MQFLSEMDHNVKFLEESKGDEKDLYLEGITLVADTKNANKRIYPKRVLHEAIENHTQNFLNSNGAVGELNHPTENISQIDFDKVSHRFISIREEGNNFITKALVINTTSGKQVKNLHAGGVRLGISSRAFGETKLQESTAIVQSLYIVSFGDIVANPSAPGAFMNAVTEQKEWLWENGRLIEKDLSRELEGYKKIIECSTKKERLNLFTDMFKDYLLQIKR